MRRTAALLTSTALILPTAAVVAPAEAASQATGDRIVNCSKSKHGTTVRVKMRDNGEFVRIRISHPHGDGNFDNNRIRRVLGSTYSVNQNSERIRFTKHRTLPPSFRAVSRDIVEFSARFELKNGKVIIFGCMVGEFPPCPDCEVGSGVSRDKR